MRKYALTSILVFPLLLTCAQAAQNWSVDQPAHAWVFSSDDGGTSSYLGVDIADVTTDRLGALKLKEEKGVEVTMVDQDAPAGKAGIKEHDVILTMNGTAIESGAQLRRMIHETPPGRMVSFGLSREGQPLTIKVQLADKHQEYPNVRVNPNIHIPEIHIPNIEMPNMNLVVVTQAAHSGLMVENLTPQLGEFFGVKDGNGVLVRSVDKGSRAEKAGFRAGDIIVKINDQSVHDTSDFSHAVKSRSNNTINVGVIREKREQKLNLTLPEQKDSSWFQDDESLVDQPKMNADAAYELTRARARLKGEVARAKGEVARVNADEYRKAAEQLRKSFQEQEKKWREEGERIQQQFRKQGEELRRQLEQMRSQQHHMDI